MNFLWMLPFLTMHRVMATGNFLLAVFSQVLPTTVLEIFSPIPRPPLLLFLMLLSSTRTIPFCLISNWASVFFHRIPNHSELLIQTKNLLICHLRNIKCVEAFPVGFVLHTHPVKCWAELLTPCLPRNESADAQHALPASPPCICLMLPLSRQEEKEGCRSLALSAGAHNGAALFLFTAFSTLIADQEAQQEAEVFVSLFLFHQMHAILSWPLTLDSIFHS